MWLISPLIGAAFAAIIFASLKFCVLERQDAFKKAMRAIPFYFAFTGGILALFITIEAPGAPDLYELGAGTVCAIVLGSFFGVLGLSYLFSMPYAHRIVVLRDSRMRPWHILLGPLLRRENPPLFFAVKDTMLVDHYQSAHDKAPPTDLQPPRAETNVEPAGGGARQGAALRQPHRAPVDVAAGRERRLLGHGLPYCAVAGEQDHAAQPDAGVCHGAGCGHHGAAGEPAGAAGETITGAVLGVSLMNLDLGATNWRQVAFIFLGWVLTLPVVALMSGLLTAMALNVPQFN